MLDAIVSSSRAVMKGEETCDDGIRRRKEAEWRGEDLAIYNDEYETAPSCLRG